MSILSYKHIRTGTMVFLILFFLLVHLCLMISTVSSAYKTHQTTIQFQQKNSEQKKNQNENKKLSGEKANSTLWSNAFNFQKTWNTQTDPRTGLFFAHIKTGSLISNTGHGPNINLEVNYNSNSTGNPDDLGKGWSWNLTHFNPQSNQLFTSQGKSFNLQKTFSGHWWPRYHKLHDLKIDGSKKNYFRITYTNGLREILNHQG